MQTTQAKNQTGGILGLIERVGNKIPDITILFIGAFIICCIMSAILSTMHFGYVHPTTGKEIVVNNMLSGKNLVALLSKMVTNYSGFPPLGMVIVATLGIGIADGSGYINTALKKILAVTPKFLITPIIILVGMLSHLGPDTGYVIIIPVAAYMYYASGKASIRWQVSAHPSQALPVPSLPTILRPQLTRLFRASPRALRRLSTRLIRLTYCATISTPSVQPSS